MVELWFDHFYGLLQCTQYFSVKWKLLKCTRRTHTERCGTSWWNWVECEHILYCMRIAHAACTQLWFVNKTRNSCLLQFPFASIAHWTCVRGMPYVHACTDIDMLPRLDAALFDPIRSAETCGCFANVKLHWERRTPHKWVNANNNATNIPSAEKALLSHRNSFLYASFGAFRQVRENGWTSFWTMFFYPQRLARIRICQQDNAYGFQWRFTAGRFPSHNEHAKTEDSKVHACARPLA